ncbi:hypothetical protein BJ322DRAFT_1026313 [Thelephora terrestris]|uniref:Secreted protein n=1 Tax=Thelephora terrestris TaxID=56493 RepID=A0A9P6LBQ4_9AGAM|nr:hypothetical protein BJ322DRAFT_1026313 [Thelephora terrestris]
MGGHVKGCLVLLAVRVGFLDQPHAPPDWCSLSTLWVSHRTRTSSVFRPGHISRLRSPACKRSSSAGGLKELRWDPSQRM